MGWWRSQLRGPMWLRRGPLGWLLVALMVAGVILAVNAPIDPSRGLSQKLIYIHLPVALSTLLAALVVCIASVAYLGWRNQMWDDLGHAAAVVAVVNGTVLLLTGVIWARLEWQVWWTWSPRLVFSLLLWLLYSAYLVVRSRVASPERRAMVSAVYGVVAFLDVPLLYLASKLLPDVHPTGSGLTSGMLPAMGVWGVLVIVGSGVLLQQQMRRGH